MCRAEPAPVLLVVEDEKDIRRFVRTSLESETKPNQKLAAYRAHYSMTMVKAMSTEDAAEYETLMQKAEDLDAKIKAESK